MIPGMEGLMGLASAATKMMEMMKGAESLDQKGGGKEGAKGGGGAEQGGMDPMKMLEMMLSAADNKGGAQDLASRLPKDDNSKIETNAV